MNDYAAEALVPLLVKNLRTCRRLSSGFGLSIAKKGSLFFGQGNFATDYCSLKRFKVFKMENGNRSFKLTRFYMAGTHSIAAGVLFSKDVTRVIEVKVSFQSSIGIYRAYREKYGLPCRGQRTKTNNSTRRVLRKKKQIKRYFTRRGSSVNKFADQLHKYFFDKAGQADFKTLELTIAGMSAKLSQYFSSLNRGDSFTLSEFNTNKWGDNKITKYLLVDKIKNSNSLFLKKLIDEKNKLK